MAARYLAGTNYPLHLVRWDKCSCWFDVVKVRDLLYNVRWYVKVEPLIHDLEEKFRRKLVRKYSRKMTCNVTRQQQETCPK